MLKHDGYLEELRMSFAIGFSGSFYSMSGEELVLKWPTFKINQFASAAD